MVKVAIPQKSGLSSEKDVNQALLKAAQEASRQAADILIFPEYMAKGHWPDLGFLIETAGQCGIWLITGNVKEDYDGGMKICSWVISAGGELIAKQEKINPYVVEKSLVPGEEIAKIDLPWGEAVILMGLDVLDTGLQKKLSLLKPDFLCLLFTPDSMLEEEALRELALDHTRVDANVVIVPSALADDTEIFSPGGFIACESQIISEGNQSQEIVIQEINKSRFLPKELLEGTIDMPEILRQRFHKERSMWPAA